MNEAEIRDICDERLSAWEELLVKNHATPALLVGLGHDATSGQIHLLTVDDITLEQMQIFLAFAYNEVTRRRFGGGLGEQN